MQETRIIPSIIAETQQGMEQRIKQVEDAVEWLQLDVMDGNFVPTHSIDFDFSLPETKCKFEAHLMVQNPLDWVEKHGAKVDTILFHIEPCQAPEKVIDAIKQLGKKPGIALNPETGIEAAKPLFDSVEEVLVMTVKPGYYGAKFLPETLEKVKELRQLAPDIDIEVDGGIGPETIGLARQAGANFFISGSYIQKADNAADAVAALKKLVE